MAKLKPCPQQQRNPLWRCEAEPRHTDEGDMQFVYCWYCREAGPVEYSEARAMGAWNRRHEGKSDAR